MGAGLPRQGRRPRHNPRGGRLDTACQVVQAGPVHVLAASLDLRLQVSRT